MQPFSWVERVSLLIVHNYNAEPFKALIGKYCIHLESQRKYIGKQSVITQSGTGPGLEIHTPANSTRRFLMTVGDQASVPCPVPKVTLAAEPASKHHGQGPAAQCCSVSVLTELTALCLLNIWVSFVVLSQIQHQCNEILLLQSQ